MEKVIWPYGVNAAEREHGREHAQVFPVQLLLLLRQNERLDQTIRYVLPCVHPRFHSHDHGAVNFQDPVMELATT